MYCKKASFIPESSALYVGKCNVGHSIVSDSLWPHGLWPGSSAHGILQARILECVAISFSKNKCNSRMMIMIYHQGKLCKKSIIKRGSRGDLLVGWFTQCLLTIVKTGQNDSRAEAEPEWCASEVVDAAGRAGAGLRLTSGQAPGSHRLLRQRKILSKYLAWWHSTAALLPGKSMDGGAWWAAVHGVAKSRTRLGDFTFTFHFHAWEEEMAPHSSVLAWRVPGTGEPGGLLSVGSDTTEAT